MANLLVLGTGLIGTSVGLALRQASGYRIFLSDVDAATQASAVARGAGEAWNHQADVDMVLVAAPPSRIAGVLAQAQTLVLARTYTHVCSVQSHVQREVEALGCDLSSIVGGHPLAGREVSGPGAASADLFAGRPWALCPSPTTHDDSLDDLRTLALACGAVPMIFEAAAHDEAVALLSHLPQVVSSALAAMLVDGVGVPEVGDVNPRGGHTVHPDLSGAGLVDTTRLAAADPTLWTEILAANAAQVAPAVRALTAVLSALTADLENIAAAEGSPAPTQALAGVAALLERGNRGRARVPVKRGDRDDAFAPVAVEVDDLPGRLAALLTAAGEAGVNVEDVRVDHIPGRPRGVIELLVDAAAAPLLSSSLRAAGWSLRTGLTS